MGIVTVYEDARTAFAHDDALFMCAWRDAPTAVQMRAMEEHARRVEAVIGPLVLLNVAIEGVPTFSEEVRTLAARYTRDPTLFARARAHVVAMSGLKGIAVLSFINTFLLLGRSPVPTKVFRSIGDAIAWALPLLPPAGWTADRIDGDFAALRERLYAQAR